ncbi:Ig-like domain-containing protein [Termitidicoccus mucosus]|uniref:rhamnogalacturonan lyase family protein n=1 Tax=Termitidicoccus mucosus TaxID=1184151 RepID=UPI0011AB3C0C
MVALVLLALCVAVTPARAASNLPSLMEKLDRGLVVVRTESGKAFASWRLLGTEPIGTAFNIYRSTGGAPSVKLNSTPLSGGTNFIDTTADFTQPSIYTVRPVLGGVEQPSIDDSGDTVILSASATVGNFIRIPLTPPANITMPDGTVYSYSSDATGGSTAFTGDTAGGTCSVGDLDGDGQYEVILKWAPSKVTIPGEDSAPNSYFGNVYIDAYKLIPGTTTEAPSATRLWRIDAGINVRDTPFLVYDLDGCGKAEVVLKTADGTIDGQGNVIGDPNADYRESSVPNTNIIFGRVLSGPEYLTVFNGIDGAALESIPFRPERDPDNHDHSPTLDRQNAIWGDRYGKRMDGMRACVAYLDGQRPSIVFARGIYTRVTLAAWDFRRNGNQSAKLAERWYFDSDDGTPGNIDYRSQGNHQLALADVDDDGCDEIVYGAATIDHDGTGLYSTGLRHGDKMIVSKMSPDSDDILVWACHEEVSKNGYIGHTLRKTSTGETLFSITATTDTDGAMAADIDPRSPGWEIWGARSNIRSAITFEELVPMKTSMTFAAWWDGDLLRSPVNNNIIFKWNWNTNKLDTLFSSPEVAANEKPLLCADIFGDWREELIMAEADGRALRIYTTAIPTAHRITTLMPARQYRVAIAYQNVGYRQSPCPSFYIGHDMRQPPTPNIVTSLDELLGPPAPVITAIQPDTGFSATDFITSNPNITLVGTAEPNVTVCVTLAGAGVVGTTTADISGNWIFDGSSITLSEGKSYFTAAAIGPDGHTGASSKHCTVTVMTTPPPAPTIESVTAADAGCAFTGTAQPRSLITISASSCGDLGTVQADADGVWIFECELPATGAYTFVANAVDEAGNAAVAPSAGFAVNTAIATPTISGIANDTGVSSTDGITSDKHVTLHGTAPADDTVTVYFAGIVIGSTIADAGGAWSLACADASGLADGEYAFTAVARRGASGNSLASPTFAVMVDTVAPIVDAITRPEPDTGSKVTFQVEFSEPVVGATTASLTPVLTGGLAGSITAVTALTNNAYLSVTVGNLDGDGTLRLDINNAVSGITDIAGNALATTSITSETITRSRFGDGVWANTTPGGLWSDADNWLEGTRAQGVGKIADFSTLNLAEDTTVIVDTSGTVGKIIFSDTDSENSCGWLLAPPATGVAPALRLVVASGTTPEINVSALALDVQATIAVPLAGTQGFSKTGGSMLALTGSNALTGGVIVSVGDLAVGEGGVLNIGSSAFSIASSARLIVNGGLLQTTSRVDGGASSAFIIEAGCARMATFRSSTSDLGYVLVTGGTFIATEINIRRSAGGIDYATGFIVRGGEVDAVTVGIGTANSSAAMSVEGGNVLVTGTFTVGNQTSPGRASGLRVIGGSLVSTETTNGLILSKANGSNANTPGIAIISGGTATFEKITLGYDSTVTSGTAAITIDGGALHLGSGGIVKNGASTLTSRITLASGTLGAKAAWTTAHPIVLTGDIVIETTSGITLTGAISGTGGFTKTGAGTLTLTGTNTFTGAAIINEGTLAVTGTFAKFAKLTWNSAAALQFDVAHGDRLVVTGTLLKSGSAARQIILTNAGALTAGATHILGTINATTLTSADFAPILLGNELRGNVTISGKSLVLTVVTAPPATAPVFTSPANDTARAGADFTYAATLANGTATYTISGLPPGLLFNTTTGVISGRPTASGTYAVRLRATNATGSTDFTLMLTIAPASDTDTHTALVTLAGFAKSSGATNGQTMLARFNSPVALLAHANGNLYIADTGNNALRIIDPPGIVSTLATTGATLSSPGAIIVGGGSTLLIADTNNNAIRSLDLATAQLTTFATDINRPAGLARDTTGNLYVSTADNIVVKFAAGATTSTTLAGGFNTPTALALGPDGQLYVADTGNHAIRRIDLTTSGSIGSVVTIAGRPGVSGTANGDALDARFNHPKGLALDAAGNLYVADTGNHAIRHLDTFTNQVTTRSGLIAASGTADGLGAIARLNAPAGLAIDSTTGDIYIADTGNHTIRILLDSPRILKHPENKNVTAGAAASFSVLAIGAPNPAYQWRHGGTNIAGATGYTHTIASAQTAHAGNYTVVVSNEMGSVTSSTATLTVTATSSGTTTPPSNNNTAGGGGGGGAPALWYFLALALIVFVRCLRRSSDLWVAGQGASLAKTHTTFR